MSNNSLTALLVVLQIVMIVAKIANWMNISWWLVFLPLYVYIVLVLLVLLFLVGALIIAWHVSK